MMVNNLVKMKGILVILHCLNVGIDLLATIMLCLFACLCFADGTVDFKVRRVLAV